MNTPWGPSTSSQPARKPQIVTFPVDSGPKNAFDEAKFRAEQRVKRKDEEFEHKGQVAIVHCTAELSKQIQQARCAKEPPLSQKDLDKKCNFPSNTVRDYENGTASVVPSQLAILSRELNVQLKRPPKSAKTYEP
jgi:ribosome-binding protein aMBF1 (putative translation factor)